MVLKQTRARLAVAAASLAISAVMLSGAQAQEKTRLTFLTSSSGDVVAITQKLVEDFQAANPDIEIELETRPAGAEGDNIVKTRLATGEMTDIFQYNSGSLFQTLNPKQNLVPVSDQPFQKDVTDLYKSVVSADGEVYGTPMQTAMGGGILYNRKIYKELGLEVPKTWDQFMANNAKIKEAGKVPVVQSFGTTWTAQVFVLTNHYNVQAADPDFAKKYTANQAKYATTPAALSGFQKQADVLKAGYLNPDFAATTWNQGLGMIANGEAAHYPMITSSLPTLRKNFPEGLPDIGFFGMPGDNPEKNGLTSWMPAGIYIPKTTEKLDAAYRFLAFVASVDGCKSQVSAVPPAGPFMVNGCTLPADVPPVVSDMLPYFEEGRAAPALEFVSPIKGPNLEQIAVEVGMGSKTPEEGAKLYDEDVRKQALQLGLPGW